MDTSDWSLADHAEYWWVQEGNIVPERDTPEWMAMYESWVNFAFADFAEAKQIITQKIFCVINKKIISLDNHYP